LDVQIDLFEEGMTDDNEAMLEIGAEARLAVCANLPKSSLIRAKFFNNIRKWISSRPIWD